jgi:superfamily I DNA/RNA helicase
MARTNRGLALAETYCRMKKIPFRLLGKSGFFKLPAVVRAVAKLRQYADLPTAAAWAITMPGLESYYQTEDATPEDDRAVKSLKTLEQISRQFTLCREFVDFAHGAAHSKKSKKPSLALSTCHQTKGLEFSNVFLMQVRLDNMPHIKGDPAPDGEEARIFLVSISRPKNRLHISWSGTPSVYLHKDLTPAEIVALQEQASRPQLAGPQQNNLFEAQ